MSLVRIFVTLVQLFNSICKEYTRRKNIEYGKEQAIRNAKKVQQKKIYRARKARLAVRNNPSRRMRKDPYRRD